MKRWTVFVVLCIASSIVTADVEDVRKETPQEIAERISAEVEQIRGLSFERPVPVQEIDDLEARAYMLERLDKFETLDQIDDIERAYALLGLVPQDSRLLESFLDVMRQQAGGFYDPDSGSFYVLDDIPLAIAPVIVAHELTHALEDQHFGLDSRLEQDIGDDDRLLAHATVHEGSATLLMTVFMTRAALRGELEPEVAEQMATDEMGGVAALDALPEVFRRQLIAPYVLGPTFITEGNLLGTVAEGFPVERVDRLYADPPSSSEQILHPERYWDDTRRDEPRTVVLGDAGGALGRGWELQQSGTLGELTLGPLVGATTPGTGELVQSGASWTSVAATGWGGDRWELWGKGKRDAALLGTRWDSEQDAREFADALPADAGLHWRRSGESVAVVAGVSGRRADVVIELMLAEMASPTLVPETGTR